MLRTKCVYVQVWNVNAHTGIVGVFNLQGSSWDRVRRQYFVHDASPPKLHTLVRPFDIEPFRRQQQERQQQHTSFACYSSQSRQLVRLAQDEGCSVELPGAALD